MKKTLILISLFLWSVATIAQTTTQRLVVWQKNGAKVYYDLAEEPETTFEDGKLVIKTKSTTVSYQLENLLRYTYEGTKGTPTAISPAKLRPGETVFRQDADKMSFDGLPEGTVLNVYSLDGKLLQTLTAHGGMQTIISFVGQPAGTYIVKAGDATYKFLKR